MREHKTCISDMKNRTGWMRHTLIWLTPAGRRFAAAHIRGQLWTDSQWTGNQWTDSQWTGSRQGEEGDVWRESLVMDNRIPGILCRQPKDQSGIWTCGFSHWEFEDGRRRRLLADFRVEDVERTCSPFELCSGKQKDDLCRRYPQLRAVFSAAEACGLECGIYGSTALEWVTGLMYRHADSDFDLYVRQKPGGDAGRFERELARLERDEGIRLDVELELDGCGVKLKELAAPGRTVLGKGLYDVRLFEKKEGTVIPCGME